ncbi:hypothetical protein ACLKMY_31135 [Paraburkholderia mimosarum]|uniref:hypothetical protein n=1 Tax=Paraburkholderia mimosarum TaxID=312026 RepID=UPI0003FD760F|nr:hypothetical protein [Paraburkholderia mimosarum]
MQIIEIEIEYAGGLTIVDQATWNQETGDVLVSERLKQIVRELDTTEARPSIKATFHGQKIDIEPTSRGDFRLPAGQAVRPPAKGFVARLRQFIRQPTKDQRQQAGRYLHTLSAGATIGATGFWHSTTTWGWQNVLAELNLCVAAVVLFYAGIVSMNGD